MHGDTIPFLPGYFVTTEHVPYGVTAHVIPWNYPAQMFGRTVGPALAMGNACVMKPAEDACLTTLRIAELAAEIGLPEGALNIVPGLGEEAGAALSSHPGIDFISFTGSPGSRHADPDRGRAKPHRLHARTRRQVAACRLRRCRHRGRGDDDRR